MSTTGKKTKKDPLSFDSWDDIPEVSPDDPIFKHGFIVGGYYSRPYSKGIEAKNSSNGKKKQS